MLGWRLVRTYRRKAPEQVGFPGGDQGLPERGHLGIPAYAVAIQGGIVGIQCYESLRGQARWHSHPAQRQRIINASIYAVLLIVVNAGSVLHMIKL